MNNNIDKITNDRQRNMSEIRQKSEMFQDQIRQMRVRINSHIDTLQHNILQELNDTEGKINSKIDQMLIQLSKTVEELQRDMIAVKEYASDLHTFIGSKAMGGDVKKEEEYLMFYMKMDVYNNLS